MKYQGQSHTILVVEDSDEDFDAIRWAFEKLGVSLSIIRCADGEDALDFLYQQGKYARAKNLPRPSIIWLDLNLPRASGREVLEQIKADISFKNIPIIMVTSSFNADDIELCYQQGANS